MINYEPEGKPKVIARDCNGNRLICEESEYGYSQGWYRPDGRPVICDSTESGEAS